MFHGLWLIMALILAVSLSLYLVVMAVLVTAYLLFCGPYLWWACAHLPRTGGPSLWDGISTTHGVFTAPG